MGASDDQRFELGFECVDCFLDWLNFVKGGPVERASVETLGEFKEVLLGNIISGNFRKQSFLFTAAVTWIPPLMVWYLSSFLVIKKRLDCCGTISARMQTARGSYSHLRRMTMALPSFRRPKSVLGKRLVTFGSGDSIVLLSGSDWPVVLRPVGETYHYVGRTYVQGIMGG